MFALHSVYLKPLEEVDRYVADHRAFLKGLYEKGITIVSGPQIPRKGGFILLNASSKEEAIRIMADDPYVVNEIAEYSVIEFEAKSWAEGFGSFIKK